MIDQDPSLRYRAKPTLENPLTRVGVTTAVVGPLLAAILSQGGEPPSVAAQTVSSGTAIDLCNPTLWRPDSIRTDYPAPLPGMKRGDDYTIRETLKRWDGSVLIGDSIKIGSTIDEKYVSPQHLKITLFTTDDTDGSFEATVHAGWNIRYDFFDSNPSARFDKASLDELTVQSIDRARRYQGGTDFVIVWYNTSAGQTSVLYRFTTAQADEFIRQQQEAKAKACATPTPSNTAPSTSTETSTSTSTSTKTPTVTTTPMALLTATATSTEVALSTITSTSTATREPSSTSTSTPTRIPSPTPSPTIIPPVIKSPTPDNLNCGFRDVIGIGPGQGWSPDLRGGDLFPPGEDGEMVDIPIQTPAFNTSVLITPRLDYRLPGGVDQNGNIIYVGQWYPVKRDRANEYVIASFPGGEHGTNWLVRLPARRVSQFQGQDPPFGWSPAVMDAFEVKGIFLASSFKRMQGLSLESIELVRFDAGGAISSTPLNALGIASRVRYAECRHLPVALYGNISSGW